MSKVVFKHHFAYTLFMNSSKQDAHPATVWMQDAQNEQGSLKKKLRLAAMAGHMQIDKIAARRAALIDLLADGRSHPREEIWERLTLQLGASCWGSHPHEALARDLAALRKGGIRIAYSRQPETTGYYLQHPALSQPEKPKFESINWQLIKQIRKLSSAEKNERAFAAAHFAYQQKQLVLAEEHPNWPAQKINKEAQKLVFGVINEAPA